MKVKFDEYKAKYPEWSDEQIWAAISLNMEADNVIEKGGQDVNPNDPDIIIKVIKGAKKWIEAVLPDLFVRVAHAFDKAINTLGVWVRKGLTYAVDLIAKLLGKEKYL